MTHASPEQQPTRPPERLSESDLELLRTLADCGSDGPVLEYLHSSGLYERAVGTFLADTRVDARTFGELLATLPANDRDRERLLVSWLHHRGTAWHGLISGDYARLVLANEPELTGAISREGVTIEDVLRSTLLHDDGKKSIPRSILANTTDEKTCTARLSELVSHNDTETLTIVARILGPCATMAEIEVRMEDNKVRPISLVPIRHIVSAEDIATLEERGCTTTERTLMDVIAEHEHYTRERLADEPTIANIAGYHHSVADSTFPLSASLVGSTSRIAQEFLHAIDRVEAITAARDYKPGAPLVVALVAEIHEALRGAISDFVVFSVVRALYTDSEQVRNECSVDPDSCRAIDDYLASHFTLPQAA